jgi:hypothetical protein
MLNLHQNRQRLGFAPDPTRGAYSAPPDSLTGLGEGEGEEGVGKEGKEGRGKEGEGKGERSSEG